ncbi:MAG: hypothetical protein GVY17_07620 [Cyanobacteria bacterium]|jgi:RIO-like serine/threonine protein kinase|nr:hypothetical protein [Cyanobacteria bacterium GSL.Bin21]
MFHPEIYRQLAFNQSPQARFDSGYWSDILPGVPGTVEKTTNNAFGLEEEYAVMVALWEAGFFYCPQPLALENEGDTIVMREIVYGAQLVEVLDLYQAGSIPRLLVLHLLDQLRDVLIRFWATGFAHGDLHSRNLLVGIDGEKNWKVWLIDFGQAKRGGDPSADQQRVAATLASYGFEF